MFKTITLTGTETAVKFNKQYPYFWARNLGESDIYMSVKPGIIPDSDGVTVIPAGGGASTEYVGQVNTLYLLGSGKIAVSTQFNGICPFFKPRKGGNKNTNILSGAIYRYKNEITVSSTIIDTGIPQSILSGKGFTAAFVFMPDAWTNFYGLFGMHNGGVGDTPGLCCQYGNGYLSFVLPNCRGDCIAPSSGEKMIFILSDSANNSYVYYNGVRHDIMRYENAVPFTPLNNICLLKSYSGGGSERCYHGTIYDIALFDRGLSDNECAALTNYFSEIYDIRIYSNP